MIASVITLGCKVNEYESQSILNQLKSNGYEIHEGLVPADVYIVNTCAVTNIAERKSRQVLAKIHKLNENAKIVLCGCAVQNNPTQFLKNKNVIAITGSEGKHDIMKFINSKNLELPDLYDAKYINMPRPISTRTRQFIKIQDGCNNFCTYCIIPYLRGRSRSRDLEDILDEIKHTDSNEIVLTGIDMSDYKINGVNALKTLVREVDKLNIRFRISSLECNVIDEDLLDTLAQSKHFCPHFHLSLQSGSDSVLKRMNRHYTTSQFLNSINLIRKYFPSSAITTDVIVGFPEETEKEFNETVEFIKKANFARLHVFKYSKRTGTVASKIFKDCPPSVKEQRSQILLKLSEVLHEKFIKQNKSGMVLIEEKEGDYLVGYTENYIKCYIKSNKVKINQIVKVKIKTPYLDGAIAKVVN